MKRQLWIVVSLALCFGLSNIFSSAPSNAQDVKLPLQRNSNQSHTQAMGRSKKNMRKEPPSAFQGSKDESTILYESVEGESFKVRFTKKEVSRFAAALKTNNTDEVKSFVELVSDALKESGIDCCEERKKVGTCRWVCCDGSKVSTCNDQLNKALTILWAAEFPR